MKLHWSHAVLNARDLQPMLDFYTGVMGFTISDRGPMGAPGAPEIVFMSNSDDEHHQLAIVAQRDESPATSLNHLAFRVESFDEVKEMSQRLQKRGVDILPLSHGNTLSLYFNDPEKNGVEVFWDTPWHVDQPQGVLWDTNLDEAAALQFVEDSFRSEPSFTRREDCHRPFANRPA
ncbi:MAG: VOC family protein [Pseudomonadales bacterium]